MTKPRQHDPLFVRTMSKPENAQAVLSQALPKALQARMDWSTLKPAPTRLVDEVLKEKHSDVLYEALLDGETVFLFLTEHQSTEDPRMALRIFFYTARIWETWLRQHEDATKVPPVIPLVVHHGERPWRGPTDVVDAIAVDASTREVLGDVLPRQRFVLDDLRATTAESLADRGFTPTMTVTYQLFHYTPLLREDPLSALRAVWEQFWALRDDDGGDFVALLHYTIGSIPAANIEEVYQFMQEHMGDAYDKGFQSIADYEREKGREESRHETRHETLKGTLKKQLRIKFGELSFDVSDRLDQATSEELDQWTERVLIASTLDELFE